MAASFRGVILDLFYTLTGRESEWSHLPVTPALLGVDRRRWDHALTETSAALARLREAGLRIGLITNADTIEMASWAQCPLAGLFDAEVISCHVGMAKPDPEIFRKCLEMLDLPASDCIFVGDGGSNELAAAKGVGLRTVLAVTGLVA